MAKREAPALPALVAPYTADEIEAGRKLFTGEWAFIATAGTLARLPPMQGVEIALAGRSNVGKSSLVNALTGRKALARTSVTPGRTQELIFFSLDRSLTLVDMPGYGYAEAPKDKVIAWQELIGAYLSGRTNLARVFLLVDARHGAKAIDTETMDELDRAAVSYMLVATKTDKLKPAEVERLRDTLGAVLRKRPAAYPEIAITSVKTDAGIPELRAAIARLMAERR
jgi:GTP-binding protein